MGRNSASRMFRAVGQWEVFSGRVNVFLYPSMSVYVTRMQIGPFLRGCQRYLFDSVSGCMQATCILLRAGACRHY